jgi:hypothetical protein
MQVELGNGSDLRYLELSRLGPEAILSYLELGRTVRNAPRHLMPIA